jgi:Flp pilus assembly protein TadG
LLRRDERGQVLVMFALLLPVLLVLGSVVLDVGNWYVLRKHLQTQVDAAALAGGPAFTGCFQNPTATRDAIKLQALGYAGDPTRAATSHNKLMEDTQDVHAVLNSNNYWADGDVTDGSTLDWTQGDPCTTKFLDVKATDDSAPSLWKWLPFYPDLKTRAKVKISQVQSTNGMRPLGVPEMDPKQVWAVFVDENGDPSSASSIVGFDSLAHLDSTTTPPAPTSLASMSVWSKEIMAPVNLSGGTAFGVVIVASRDTTPMVLTGKTLSQICSSASGQVECYGGNQLDDGVSFIHAFATGGSGTATTPIIRGVTLDGGNTVDLSRPYFNFEADGLITISADIDFGTGTNDPRDPVAQGGVCARVDASPGGQLSWSPSTQLWTGTFTPAAGSGPNQVDLSWTTDTNGGCGGGNNGSGNFNKVAKPYAADAASGAVEYLTVQTASALFGTAFANSIGQTSTASLKVTVGLTPPLREGQLADPPIVLRGWVQPSQSQALDCLTSGASGWGDAMVNGCADPYQVYDASKHTTKCGPPPSGVPPANPKDCIDSQNGNFQENRVDDMLSPCVDNPNRWDGMTVPPATDKRWVPLFVLDQMAYDVSGKRTYPIRRFGMFYITAVSGMNCPGDFPATVPNGKRELWGHFMSFITPGFGETIPSDAECSFGNGSLCVSNLVE